MSASGVQAKDWPARLLRLRETLELTQAEAAAMLRVSRVSWNLWENGRVIPSPSYQLLLELLEKGKIRP